MRIKKNDTVKMMLGKDRGKTGKVLRSFPEEEKIIIEGLNLVKKHTKARKEGQKGQRVEVPRKVKASSAMVICPKCGKATRIAYQIQDGNKARICKKCKAEI